MLLRALLASIAILAAACASQPPGAIVPAFSAGQLLSGEVFGSAAARPLPPVELLAVNDDMREFLQRHVPDDVSDRRKIEYILMAIFGNGLDLDYNNFRTYTAQETFYNGEGNCLSFTNLFIALAREAGIRAWYQEVDIPPNWTSRSDAYLYNLHINALVKVPGSERVVDFDVGAFKEEYHRRRLGDTDALAQYHNNMGAHWLGVGDDALAFRHFRAAIELRPEAGYLWTNLGVLYRRAGAAAHAEVAFLHAIELGRDSTAMSNLASLYGQLGRNEEAEYYRSRVHFYRLENPYYLFHLAEEAYAANEFSRAEKLLRKALRKIDDEHQFHGMLGLTYAQMGDAEAAGEQFQLAAELAASAEPRERYNRKLQLLAGDP